MQVDPINPMLKPPGAKHLKVIYDELLSSFAFKFNLRRHSKGEFETGFERGGQTREHAQLARAYTRPLLSST